MELGGQRTEQSAMRYTSLRVKNVVAGLIFCISCDQCTVELYLTIVRLSKGVGRRNGRWQRAVCSHRKCAADDTTRTVVENVWVNRRQEKDVCRAGSTVADFAFFLVFYSRTCMALPRAQRGRIYTFGGYGA